MYYKVDLKQHQVELTRVTDLTCDNIKAYIQVDP